MVSAWKRASIISDNERVPYPAWDEELLGEELKLLLAEDPGLHIDFTGSAIAEARSLFRQCEQIEELAVTLLRGSDDY